MILLANAIKTAMQVCIRRAGAGDVAIVTAAIRSVHALLTSGFPEAEQQFLAGRSRLMRPTTPAHHPQVCLTSKGRACNMQARGRQR